MYCCEFENTKDGSLDFKSENILNRQLIFAKQLTPYQRKNYRWLKYQMDINRTEQEIIRDFINKFREIKIINWQEIKTSYGNWFAWVIEE